MGTRTPLLCFILLLRGSLSVRLKGRHRRGSAPMFISLPQRAHEPLSTSDCTAVVVSRGLGSTGCETPSPVLVVTELREVVFQLERRT